MHVWTVQLHVMYFAFHLHNWMEWLFSKLASHFNLNMKMAIENVFTLWFTTWRREKQPNQGQTIACIDDKYRLLQQKYLLHNYCASDNKHVVGPARDSCSEILHAGPTYVSWILHNSCTWIMSRIDKVFIEIISFWKMLYFSFFFSKIVFKWCVIIL